MTMCEKLITEEMLDSMKKTDLAVLQLLTRNIRCENVAVYDKIMDYCDQLHISAYGHRENLTITT